MSLARNMLAAALSLMHTAGSHPTMLRDAVPKPSELSKRHPCGGAKNRRAAKARRNRK